MAANATITGLTATAQAGLTAGQALPADILALSSGLVSESATYAAATLARRVGILSGGINVATYNGDSSLGKDGMRFNECVSSDAFARASIAADSDLGQLRFGLPLSTARMNALATSTIARATNFQTLFGATLPS